jgi:electron-transferring-flavoprotein dehydrogenase
LIKPATALLEFGALTAPENATMTPAELLAEHGPREVMAYDVVVVGAGPAGLAAAIRLKQRAAEHGKEVSVVVLEKGSEAGAHIVSGALMDPKALTELIPDWAERGAPLNQRVTADSLQFLSARRTFAIPAFLIPKCLHNEGNYVISLSNLVRWLAQQAESLGVEIFPGFAAAEVLFNEHGAVKGVATGVVGLDKHGKPTAEFQLGMELHAKYTLFAEGSRGQLGKQLVEKYQLAAGKDPQTYALGIKELWEIDPAEARPGHAVHTLGWPMNAQTYGGGFLYHLPNNQVTLGFITGLEYSNPWLSPYEEMQRWKTHPAIAHCLQGGKRVGYGARSITCGGLASLPKTVFAGGALMGCEAGFLNFARIKGSHAAIKTGMLAAEAAFEAVTQGRQHDELSDYAAAFEKSWLFEELQASYNTKQWMKKGLYLSSLMNGIELWLLPKLGLKAPPWRLHHQTADHITLKLAVNSAPIDYPKADGKLTFDRLSSVFLSNTHHAENQPAHLTLKNPNLPALVNWPQFAGPESRYCPAGVYEYVKGPDATNKLQINAQNCVHCKTCDIKDPLQNIVWLAPEGGGGPNYSGM